MLSIYKNFKLILVFLCKYKYVKVLIIVHTIKNNIRVFILIYRFKIKYGRYKISKKAGKMSSESHTAYLVFFFVFT